MKVRFIGDVHGRYRPYAQILRTSPFPTVQVGDLGVGFLRIGGYRHGEPARNPPHRLMIRPPGHRFLRGNHDNPTACSRHSQWIPDGTVENGDNGPVMFVGGATSIDRAFRLPNFSWWEDEELSVGALGAMIDRFASVRPTTMVTHECPEQVAREILRRTNGRKIEDGSRTRAAFDQMWQRHSPKTWIFGHWHVPVDIIAGGTHFICLPELATVDIDV